jgi:hypothetical protein
MNKDTLQAHSVETTKVHRKKLFPLLPVLTALALLFSLGACSNVEVPDLKRDVEREQIIPPGWEPVPLRVGLAPFRSSLELDEARTNVDDTRRWVLPADEARLNGPDGLHQRMLQVFREYDVFEAVQAIDGADENTPRNELQAQALRQGLDVVIVPTLRRHDVGYVDTNSAYGWNMFIWWMVSPIFSWWVADEDFDANMHVDLRLYPTTRDIELAGHRLQPPETVVRSLDVWDEGFNLFSIFTTPRHFDESNWTRIGDLLMPIAENEAHKAALRYATTDLRELATQPGFREGIRRRVGLVIGVDGTAPMTRFAARDAQEFAVQLLEARNHGVPEDALRTLIGPRATRRAVEQAASDLARLARFNDDVLVFFSGVGSVTEGGRPVLQLAQPAGADTETIELDTLIDLLLANQPRSITLVLDCSFTAPGDRRCAADPEVLEALRENGASGSLFQHIIERCRARGVACNILSASDAVIDSDKPMPALEIEDLAHGLFSSFALMALAGEADTERDRTVTVSEFKEYTRSHVTRIAELEGAPQTGWFHIDPDYRDMHLPAWRR